MNLISLIIDLLLVGIFVVGISLGIKRGFVKTVAKPVKFFAAVAIAISFCSAFVDAVVEPFIRTPISNHIMEYMNEKFAHLTAENVDKELPTMLKMSAGLFGINVQELVQSSPGDVVSAIVEELTSPAIHLIAIIISFIVLYFAARIALSVVISVLDAIAGAGLLGFLNKILGFVFSGAFFFIVVWAVVAVIEFVMNFAGVSFEGGFVYDMLNSLNPFELLLSF